MFEAMGARKHRSVDAMTLFLTQDELFSKSECDEIDARLWQCQKDWYRLAGAAFFTYGQPAYQVSSPELYSEAARRDNPNLWSSFEGAYGQLCAYLEQTIGEPVFFYEQSALPGFHIFLYEGHPISAGSAHVDRPYLKVNWPSATEPDPRESWSFTVPLRLPADGAGLELWDLEGDSIDAGKSLLTPEALAKKHRPNLIRYVEGKIVLFSGPFLHRIAPMPNFSESECRITLQGHCVRIDGKLVVFW